ncbi:MAG: DegT/DnrJ/EryC1/StrS family aminotransferase [Luteibaculaceae bacterium]
MQVPFLDLKANYLSVKDEVQEAINAVLENTAYILGPSVVNFENAFADAHNVAHCLGTGSGTDGNHLALWALNIGFGDEVIMPANTFIATAWGATLCGATPVFVDCEKDSYNIDPTKIEAAITSKTKAIVAVHLYGQPANMDAVKAIAIKYNLFLIEDAAQAHLAEYNGVKVGNFGITTSFSFYPGKNLGAYGEGGALVTNDSSVFEYAKKLREHGQLKKYHHATLGHNYRMEGIQGAILGVKLKYLAEWTEKRRSVAKWYNEFLAGVEEITLPKEMGYAKHVYHLFVIKTHQRDELQNYLQSNGISTGLHYPIPLHLQECFLNLGYRKGQFPISENLGSTCLSLPMFPELTINQVEFVCETIKKFYKR